MSKAARFTLHVGAKVLGAFKSWNFPSRFDNKQIARALTHAAGRESYPHWQILVPQAGDQSLCEYPPRLPAFPARPVTLTAVPYYAWANRAPGAMRVWIPQAPSK